MAARRARDNRGQKAPEEQSQRRLPAAYRWYPDGVGHAAGGPDVLHQRPGGTVIDEASAGDPTAATERLKLLDGLPTVPINDDVRALARSIVSASIMPPKAAADALHVAAAAVAGIQYLLTLNCRHIANAHELPRVYELLDRHGLGHLLICTPAEFLGGDDDDHESHT